MTIKKLKLTKVNEEYTVELGNGTVIHATDFKQLKSDVGRELSWELKARQVISIKETADHLVVNYKVWGE